MRRGYKNRSLEPNWETKFIYWAAVSLQEWAKQSEKQTKKIWRYKSQDDTEILGAMK